MLRFKVYLSGGIQKWAKNPWMQGCCWSQYLKALRPCCPGKAYMCRVFQCVWFSGVDRPYTQSSQILNPNVCGWKCLKISAGSQRKKAVADRRSPWEGPLTHRGRTSGPPPKKMWRDRYLDSKVRKAMPQPEGNFSHTVRVQVKIKQPLAVSPKSAFGESQCTRPLEAV